MSPLAILPRSRWQPYRPSDSQPWNLQRVVHLHRRAAFGATWSELQRDLRDGPDAAVSRLLEGNSQRDGSSKSADRMADRLAIAAVRSRDPIRLKASWIYRMLKSPDPLRERLTLMWHNHFATSHLKVDLAAMERQHRLLREHCRADFGTLATAIVKDPAMLVWLDAPANRKQHPNENLARELMELFTIGIGNYDERDVKEAARALTGWTVEDEQFFFKSVRHDTGEKQILGKRGAFDGDTLLQLLLQHAATAQRLAWRLCDQFFGEGAVTTAERQELAEQLISNGLDIDETVATILRSQAFFAEANTGTRIAEPVTTVIAAIRAFERFDPMPSTFLVAEWCTQLGQDLFNPPNVGGWPGGRSWLTSRTVIARSNFAVEMLAGEGIGLKTAAPFRELFARHGNVDDAGAFADWCCQLITGQPASPSVRQRLLATRTGDDADLRRIAAAVLTLPEAQLA